MHLGTNHNSSFFVLFIRAVWFTGVALACSQTAKYNTNLTTIHKLSQIIVGRGRFVTLQLYNDELVAGIRKTKIGHATLRTFISEKFTKNEQTSNILI